MTEIETEEIVERVEDAHDAIVEAAWHVERAVERWMRVEHLWDEAGMTDETAEALSGLLESTLRKMRRLEELSTDGASEIAIAIAEEDL